MKRPTTLEDYRSIQDAIYGGRKWIVALDVLAATTSIVKALRECGSDECLAIAASRGAGELPDPEWGPEPIVLDVEGDSMMDAIWRSQRALANLSDEHVERVDAFDPEGEVRVIGTIFDDGADVAGRRKFGRRLEAWRALEDKVVIDALWEELDVPQAPYRIVDAVWDELWGAARELDQGLGTVWAGDARTGFHGGAEFTRWVQNEERGREVAREFAEVCEQVRVMPFLEGIPCSVHGIVFPDYVVAGRPCEMLVLRKPGQSRLRYATAATFWDPPDADRAEMRALAKRVGRHLRETVDYRGTFTIDGVMTADGFRPTELNPRFGGALGLQVGGLELGLIFIDLALMEGLEIDWNPERLEEIIIENADENRRGRSNVVLTVPTDETQTIGLKFEDDGYVVVDEDSDEAEVQVMRGSSSAGTYMRLTYVPEKTPVGSSTAPRAARTLRALDDLWSLGIGEVEPARDVRSVE